MHAREQQRGQREQLEIDGDIPDARRQRFQPEHAMQQERMRDELSQIGIGRYRRVIEPGPHQRIDHDDNDQCRRVRHDQTLETSCNARQGPAHACVAVRREAGCRQVAAQHQKDLYRHARVVHQPVDQAWHRCMHHIRHRPVKREVMPDDGGAREGLGAVDDGTAGSIGHETASKNEQARHPAGHAWITPATGKALTRRQGIFSRVRDARVPPGIRCAGGPPVHRHQPLQ